MSYRIMADLEIHTEEMPDGKWRAYHDGLGILAYGQTEELAGKKIEGAASLFFDYLDSGGGATSLEAGLRKAGVDYRVAPTTPATNAKKSSRRSVSRAVERLVGV